MKKINHYFSSLLTLASIINISIFTLGINYIESEINSKNEYPSSYIKQSVQTCENADRCIDIGAAQTMTTAPTDVSCGAFVLTSISGCLDMATPESNLNDCGFNVNPTVWFRINIDSNAVQLYTFITTFGIWQPVWAIYGGDCNNLELILDNKSASPNPCSDMDTTPEVHNIGIPYDENGNVLQTLYIAVSGVGIIDNPNFTLSAFTQDGCVSCIGDDCGVPLATFEIVERSSDRPLDDLVFCHGEDVRVCLEFFYDPTETGANFFHGLIPDFGSGWDMDSFDPTNITVSPAGAEYLGPGDGDCAPRINETMPYLCSYRDATGRLRLCHILCQACPCVAPLAKGSLLPYGWFWSSEGGEGCANNCSPSSRYGVQGSNSGLQVSICMNLRTRVFDDLSECNTNKNLQIKFVTTSDGVSGCWNDPFSECLLDIAQIGPRWELDCTPPVTVGFDNVEICNHGMLNSQFFTNDGSNTPIFLEPIQNPNLSGMNPYTFLGGFGIVTDKLVNLGLEIEVAKYIVWAQDPNNLCLGPKDTFFITVNPSIVVQFESLYVCEGSCIEIIPQFPDDNENYVNFIWSTGEKTPTITVCPLETETYFVTVTDDKACTIEGSVEVVAKQNLSFDILPDSVFIFQDSTAENIEVELVNIMTHGSNFTLEWVVPQGLDGAPIDSTNKFVIYHETSISRKNPYSLCAMLINEDSCSTTKCIPVHVSRPLDSILCTSWVVDAALEFQSDSLYNCTDYGYFEIRRSLFEGVEYIVFYGYRDSLGLSINRRGRTYTLDGVLIHAFDSDVNNGACNPCQELAFEVENNIYHCQEEYPMCCNLEISGFVFFDNVEMPNGIFDPGESEMSLIDVELWAVLGDGCPKPLDKLLSRQTTNGQGKYNFTDLKPGTYRVLISNSMLNPGGPLFGFSASTPIDFCIEIDCDFDPSIRDYDFGFYFVCGGSGPIRQRPNCQLASENPVICNLAILDQFCGDMFTQNSPGLVPNPLCPNGGTAHNMSWFAFVAGNGAYDIVLRTFDCSQIGGNIGIQAGIYKDCSFSDAVYCQSECSTGPISLPSTLLVPGEIYYFFLNGCVGSVCSYEIDVTGNYSPYVLPLPTGIKIGEGVCSLVCPEQEVQITLEGLSTGIEYTWSIIDSSGTVPADMTFFPGWPVTTENSVILAFPRVGVYTLCMESVRSHCDTLIGPYCVDVEVVTSTEEIFQYEVCTTDFPWDGSFDASGELILDIYGNPLRWSEGSITLEMIQDGITQFESEYINDCGCLYIQQIQITEPEVGMPCDDGDPETINDVIQDDCSCKGEIEVSVKNHNSSNKFNIFPNPSTGIIIVKGKDIDKSTHAIYNVDGQLKRYGYKVSGLELELDLSDFTPGIYILKIEDSQKNHFIKIIKI